MEMVAWEVVMAGWVAGLEAEVLVQQDDPKH